jgi:Amt family ammonium transporter
MVGMLLTGVFAKDLGLASGKASTFLAHLAALVIVSVFTFTGSWVLYKVTDIIIPLRVPEDQEIEGLDLSQHGETAIASELLLAPSANGNGVHVSGRLEVVGRPL